MNTVQLAPASNVHTWSAMSPPKREQHYVDVIERVLEGVQVTTTDEHGPRTSTVDLGTRGWFGVRPSSVEVSYTPDDEKPPSADDK